MSVVHVTVDRDRIGNSVTPFEVSSRSFLCFYVLRVTCASCFSAVRSFDLSLDGQLLACLFTSGSLLVVSLSDYTPLHFFSSFPLLGSAICCSCFSPPSSGSTSSHICLFSPTRHYSIIPLVEEEQAQIGEEHVEKKEEVARNSRGDGLTRQDSSSDGGDSEASSDDGERENKSRRRNTSQTTEDSPDRLSSRRRRGRRNNIISSQYTRPRVRQVRLNRGPCYTVDKSFLLTRV